MDISGRNLEKFCKTGVIEMLCDVLVFGGKKKKTRLGFGVHPPKRACDGSKSKSI